MHKNQSLLIVLITIFTLFCACTTQQPASQTATDSVAPEPAANATDLTTVTSQEAIPPVVAVAESYVAEPYVDLAISSYRNKATKMSFDYPADFMYEEEQELLGGGKGYRWLRVDFNATNKSARLIMLANAHDFDITFEELDDIVFKELTILLESALDAYADAPQIVPIATHNISTDKVTYKFRAISPLALKIDEIYTANTDIYLFSENLTEQEHLTIWESANVE